MTATAEAPLTFAMIRDAAMKLPETDKAELRAALDDALGSPSNSIPLATEEFEAELDRRHEEALRDPSVLIPMDELFARLERRVRGDH